jgi:hypothetical protein
MSWRLVNTRPQRRENRSLELRSVLRLRVGCVWLGGSVLVYAALLTAADLHPMRRGKAKFCVKSGRLTTMPRYF